MKYMRPLLTRKLLFTPGPLTTSPEVRAELGHDYGSRDGTFMEALREIRDGLISLTGPDHERRFKSILIPGSGTYSVESVITSAVPKDNGRLLILVNGAYGQRIGKISQAAGIDHEVLEFEWHTPTATGPQGE